MLPDPEAEIFISQPDGKSTVFQRHAGRPNFLAAPLTDFLELQGRVLWIGFKQRELLVRAGGNVHGKDVVIVPEIRVRAVDHQARQRGCVFSAL